MTPILAVSGPSGVGKTRLLVRLIPALRARGLTVAALKHSGHPHAFDRRGKDTHRLRLAGAEAVVIQGPQALAYFGPPREGARALARMLPPVDLILAEGWKSDPLQRIEVHRRSVSPDFLCARDRRVIALVTDEPPPRPIPCFGADDVEAVADFICARVRRACGPRGEASASSDAVRDPLALARSSARAHPSGSGTSALRAREKNKMPKKTSKQSSNMGRGSQSRRGSTSRGGGARGRSAARPSTRKSSRGSATVSEAGRKGGERTLRTRGPEFYSEIGKKGGRVGGGRGGARSGSRGGARSGGRGGARSGGRRSTSR